MRALAEMLQTGWFTEVFVKSEQSHRLKALLLARDQLVKMKRRIYNEVRDVLRPFGIRLPARAGTKLFGEAALAACREDDVLNARISMRCAKRWVQLKRTWWRWTSGCWC